MVSVFNYNSGPTYRCLFPEQPDPSSIPSCAEAGVLGVLPGIIGTMQAVEAIKVITGIGSPLSGRVLLYNALSQTTRTINLSVDSKNREIDALPEEVISCKSNPSDVQISQIEEISEDQLQQMMGQSADLQILDVRESWERELFRIQPSVHIPLGNLPSNQEGLSVLEINPNQNLVIYCKAGVRSRAACEMLQKLGCSKLFNLSHGMDGWLNQFPDLVSSG